MYDCPIDIFVGQVCNVANIHKHFLTDLDRLLCRESEEFTSNIPCLQDLFKLNTSHKLLTLNVHLFSELSALQISQKLEKKTPVRPIITFHLPLTISCERVSEKCWQYTVYLEVYYFVQSEIVVRHTFTSIIDWIAS